MDQKRRVVAFIDVQNTETTALKVLNFIFDWQKLINYLIELQNIKNIVQKAV